MSKSGSRLGSMRSFLVAMAMLSLAACNRSSEADAPAPAAQDGAKAGAASLPAGFPFGVCPGITGLTVDTRPHPHLGDEQTYVAFKCPDSVDLVSRFYQTQLRTTGWEQQGEVTSTSDGSQIMSATKELKHAMINVEPDRDDPKLTRVSIVIGPKRS